MDFEGNLARIKESIKIAKEKGARYRLGPELEICGYGCEDHFLEPDTETHSWECLADLLKTDLTDDILVEIGMPVSYAGVRYNCRVFLLNRKLVFIRPKLTLATDGNYREDRWFTIWTRERQVVQYTLPRVISHVTGQLTVPLGDGILVLNDVTVAPEVCEELFSPVSPHSLLALNGVELFTNGSGSHHQLRKLHYRVELMKGAMDKNGGVYVYANQQCCDGGRLYFDGCAMIISNGQMVVQSDQFSLREVDVMTAVVDFEDVTRYRAGMGSRANQSAHLQAHMIYPRVQVDFNLSVNPVHTHKRQAPNAAVPAKYLTVEEEIAFGPSCWLWDYLRRSGMSGYFLPLSGGADSSATAALVGIMCKLIVKDISEGNQQILADIRRVAGMDDAWVPKTAEEIANKIFVTCYMASKNSGAETRRRAAALSKQIGATHLEIMIDTVTSALEQVFVSTTNKQPKFKVHGGSETENLALQNIQARSRMVLGYLFAQLTLWSQGRKGSLLVLGSANVDEALRGYLTKYDCSAADINPIGGISKTDLKSFLAWASSGWANYTVLRDVVTAVPTAELEPSVEGHVQQDEVDMGMTYQELTQYGRLRKVHKCGPVSMFHRLLTAWPDLTPKQVAEKVKRFFYYYSVNRHKSTVLPPAYHAEGYSPDDNRYDLRQFLYNVKWPWQFKQIDAAVQALEAPPTAAPPSNEEEVKQRERALLEEEAKQLQAKLDAIRNRLKSL
jgi:NAD+ synthase (glutamine-hydrolysing)